jgi:hypothetical protein
MRPASDSESLGNSITFAEPVSRNSRLAFPVNDSLDHREELRDALDLVQCDRQVQASGEAIGISFGGGENAGVIEG